MIDRALMMMVTRVTFSSRDFSSLVAWWVNRWGLQGVHMRQDASPIFGSTHAASTST